MLAYILMPNSEQIYYIKNMYKNKKFLKHFCALHFCYTGQSMDKLSQSHFCAVGHVMEKWKKKVDRIRVKISNKSSKLTLREIIRLMVLGNVQQGLFVVY